MNTINTNKYIMLGLLSQSPKTGYEIKQMIDVNFDYYWKIGYNQIYPYLKQLVEDNYATKENKESVKGPNQIIYSITNKGLNKYIEWLQEDIKMVPTFKNEVLVKLNFGSSTDISANINLINHFKETVLMRLESIKNIKENVNNKWDNHPNKIYWNLVLNYGISISETELVWCNESIAILETNE